MTQTIRATLRRLAPAAATLVLLMVWGTACSYLRWQHQKWGLRKELSSRPDDLALKKEYAPQDCFGLAGRLSMPAGARSEMLVVAFDHSSTGREPVGSHEVHPADGSYGILLPHGAYDLLLFADLNGNGFYETSEVVARTPPESAVLVGESESFDSFFVAGPPLEIDLEKPMTSASAVRILVTADSYIVASVDDPIFSPELGKLGVYYPNRFLTRTQRWIYSVGEPDFHEVQVVLVHGIDGTPRDFRALIPELERAHYHVWLFYYPSGLALDQLGMSLARCVEGIAASSDGESQLRLAVVAHSMGGLVGRRGINELCRNGKPPYLKVYASFDTPYGGVEKAAQAVQRNAELVPSWKDIAAGSDFLNRLHETPLPKDLSFQIFFSWGNASANGPRPAGDGTITLTSQLDPRAQAAATGMTGFEDTHVGVLENPAAIQALSKLLKATTASAAH